MMPPNWPRSFAGNPPWLALCPTAKRGALPLGTPRTEGREMNAKLRGLVQDPADLLEEPDWPGLSPHLRTAVPEPEELLWVSQPRGTYRVVDYTCDCEAVFYELISCGGIYQIHKVVQS